MTSVEKSTTGLTRNGSQPTLGRRDSRRGSFISPIGSQPNQPLASSLLFGPGDVRRSNYEMRVAHHRGSAEGAVPESAYGSRCPMEQVCCGLKPDNVPVCRDSRMLQGLFGNTTDLALRKAEHAEGAAAGQIVPGQCQLGLRSCLEAGWSDVPSPKALTELDQAEEKEHYFLALRCLGLFCVAHSDENCERFAIRFKKSEVPGTVADIKQLLKTLAKIDHTNVPRFIEACEDEESITLIYEDCDGAGALPLHILTRRRSLSKGESARIFQQISAAINYCHSLHIYHWDWSIWNVLCTSYANISQIKLFGIGLAGVLHNGRSTYIPDLAWQHRGPFLYCSPELAKLMTMEMTQFAKLENSQKMPADVWGIASVMYCCISGHSPFGGSDPMGILKKIQEDRVMPDSAFDIIGVECWALLEKMLHQDPKSRLEAGSILTDPWVVVNSQADSLHIAPSIIIDRMRHYCRQKPVMHVIAKLLVQTLEPESLGAIEDAFRALDIKGDGDLDYDELMVAAQDKRQDIKEIFKAIDADGSAGISISEFIQANVYANEVLSERMLLKAFNAMDGDGSGSITPFELFKTLKGLDPTVTPDAVMEFMDGIDTDWDASIDFNEWRQRFPDVTSESKERNDRKDQAQQRHELCHTAFGHLYTDVKEMLEKVERQKKNIKHLKEVMDDDLSDKGGSLGDVEKMIYAVKGIIKGIRYPPTLQIPQQKKKQKSKLLSGCEALTMFYNFHKDEWYEKLSEVQYRTEALKVQDKKSRRRDELRFLTKDVLPLIEDIIIFFEDVIEEQQCILDAVEHNEGEVPAFPGVKKGLHFTDENERECRGVIEVHKKKRDREKEKEQEKQRQLEEMELAAQAAGNRRGSMAARRASINATQSAQKRASVAVPARRASMSEMLLKNITFQIG